MTSKSAVAFQQTARRKPVATAKFYLFDVGVANILKRKALWSAAIIE